MCAHVAALLRVMTGFELSTFICTITNFTEIKSQIYDLVHV